MAISPFDMRFFFRFEKPRHAVDEDRSVGSLSNFVKICEEIRVTEPEDGIAWLNCGPLIDLVYNNTASPHFRIEGLSVASSECWDQMHFETHF